MITDKALWLADFLYRKKKATRAQVEQAWQKSNISYGKELNRRTFQETKNKVELYMYLEPHNNQKQSEISEYKSLITSIF